MPDGFRVNLTQLQEYTNVLVETQVLYDQIEDQLSAADLTTADRSFDTLTGHPEHSGAQSDFTEACRTFLMTYRDLYSQIHALHHQISGKLNHMVQAFVETHQLYQQLDNKNAAAYDGLLDHLSQGGNNGATRSQ